MTNNSKSGQSNNNLPESLKEIGRSVAESAKKDLLQGIPEEMQRQVLNLEKKQQNLETEQLDPQEKPKTPSNQIETKEQTIFSQQEQKKNQEIQKIKEEIKLEAQKNPNNQIARNAKQETEKQLVDPGQYHKSFFQKLKKTVQSLGRLDQSSIWQDMWKTRNIYQQNFQKQGAKYWLSGERRLATQTG